MRIVDSEPMILALEKEKARDDCRGFWYSTVCSIIRLAESLPEIDATERKKGKWINNHSEQVWEIVLLVFVSVTLGIFGGFYISNK